MKHHLWKIHTMASILALLVSFGAPDTHAAKRPGGVEIIVFDIVDSAIPASSADSDPSAVKTQTRKRPVIRTTGLVLQVWNDLSFGLVSDPDDPEELTCGVGNGKSSSVSHVLWCSAANTLCYANIMKDDTVGFMACEPCGGKGQLSCTPD